MRNSPHPLMRISTRVKPRGDPGDVGGAKHQPGETISVNRRFPLRWILFGEEHNPRRARIVVKAQHIFAAGAAIERHAEVHPEHIVVKRHFLVRIGNQ